MPFSEQKHVETEQVRTHTHTVCTQAVDDLFYDKYEYIMLLELARMLALAQHDYGSSDLFPARKLWTAFGTFA